MLTGEKELNKFELVVFHQLGFGKHEYMRKKELQRNSEGKRAGVNSITRIRIFGLSLGTISC
jgi:hypothetical protein